MRPPLVVVTGTGTSVGKTHVAAALLAAWSRRGHIAGLKPIETGDGADGVLLGQMSTFHVKHEDAPYMLARPVSPHLAARAERVTIEPERVIAWVDRVRAAADGVLVELAGGLFSPLGPTLTNAELVPALRPDATLLVAPDRLGVLHDVAAVTRAAPRLLTAIVLNAPEPPDASTGTNAAELPVVTHLPVLGVLRRAPVGELVGEAERILESLLRKARP
jgi:dethiobiotin synthetase